MTRETMISKMREHADTGSGATAFIAVADEYAETFRTERSIVVARLLDENKSLKEQLTAANAAKE